VALSGLPNQAWTITTSPGAISTPGTGNSTVLTGLIANTSFTFTVTNNVNSCVSLSSLPAQINIAPIIPPVPTATSVQPNCPVPSGTITVSAPLGAYTYSIDGVLYQISPLFSGVPPGNYTVYVQDNSSGCISSNGPTVINALPTPPNITFLYVDSISCNGLSDGGAAVQVTSGGTSPFVYSWSPMGGTNDTVTNLPLGNYNIVVVDAAQCVVVQSFTIAQPSALTIFGSSTPIDCELGILGTVDVDVSGGEQPYLYTWNIPSVSTDSISNLDIGPYSVNVTDNNGCSIPYGTTIGIINDLLVNINPADTSINPGTSFVANAYSLGSDYVWTPIDGLSCTTCPNPVVSPDSSGIYYVSVSDDNGCQGSDSMSVTVKLLCGELYVPTIFSPNGIGPEANSKLWVFGKVACIKRFSFQIYDRWGEMVFESINILDGWDGNFKERPATSGNYVYKLSVLLFDDSIYNASGSLTLVR
jgi:gliding motility-associated-like protein